MLLFCNHCPRRFLQLSLFLLLFGRANKRCTSKCQTVFLFAMATRESIHVLRLFVVLRPQTSMYLIRILYVIDQNSLVGSYIFRLFLGFFWCKIVFAPHYSAVCGANVWSHSASDPKQLYRHSDIFSVSFLLIRWWTSTSLQVLPQIHFRLLSVELTL